MLQNLDVENSLNEDGNFTIQINDLVGGDYVVLIEDNYGCFLDTCFSITPPLEPDPNIFFASVDAICSESSGSAYVSGDPLDVGGTPFAEEPYYSVVWTDSDGNIVSTITPDALIASSLNAGELYC